MKIVTLTTVKGLEAKGKYSPPGEYEVPDEIGTELIKSGIAKAKAVVVAEHAATVGQVSVTQAAGPSITNPPAAAPVQSETDADTGAQVKGGKKATAKADK